MILNSATSHSHSSIARAYSSKSLSCPSGEKPQTDLEGKKCSHSRAFSCPSHLCSGCFHPRSGIFSRSNYIFDTVQPSKRARCVAYYNVVNGSMIFIGGIAGGLIASLPAVLLSSYYMIFLISGLGRYCVSLLFLHKLEEPRTVRPISYHRLFYNVAITMPTQGVM